MKSLLEKLTLDKNINTNEYFDSLLKAHVMCRRKCINQDDEFIICKNKKGKYYFTVNDEHKKVGDKHNGDDILEVIKTI